MGGELLGISYYVCIDFSREWRWCSWVDGGRFWVFLCLYGLYGGCHFFDLRRSGDVGGSNFSRVCSVCFPGLLHFAEACLVSRSRSRGVIRRVFVCL